MLDALTLVAYLLGSDAAHTERLRMQARFVENQHPTVCSNTVESPQIRWSGVPPEANSLAIIIKDDTYYYWVVYNLPIDATFLSFGVSEQMAHRDQGVNSWGVQNYHSRCWGSVMHPVTVALFALDKRLAPDKKMTGAMLEKKMKGHVLSKVTSN